MADHYALGIDIGGTSCTLALMDPMGGLHQIKSIPTRAAEGGEALIRRLLDTAEGLVHGMPVLGVGIGSAGQIDFASGSCRFATEALPGWTGMPIRDHFAQALELPVWVENDANAAALAEHRFGAGQGLTDLVCLTLGTGVGGGVICDGRIIRGPHGAAAELGHLPIAFRGAPCTCGAQGCLEAYASATGIMRMAQEAGVVARSAREVYDLATAGDPVATAITREVARYLAQGIVAMVAAYDPQAVLIGGGVAQAGELLFGPLRDELQAHPFVRGRCKVSPCALGPEAGVIGAAAQVFLYGDVAMTTMEVDGQCEWL